MEKITSAEDSGRAISIVEDLCSDGDLLESPCGSFIIPPLARSCSEISANTTSIGEDGISDSMRIRTDSSGSGPVTRPKTLGAMGHKRSRKRDKFRREVRRITTTVTMVRNTNTRAKL